MSTTGRVRLGVAIGLAASWIGTGSTAHAQDGAASEAGVFEDAPVESSAPGEDLERKIRALRWGVAISTVAIPLGVGLLLGGAGACLGNNILGSDCTTGQVAAQGIGIAFMVAGTAGMITSAILLRRRKRERMGLHADRRLRWSYTKSAFVF